MNTPTHLLINWTIAKSFGGKTVRSSAVLLGAAAPDLPLYALSFGGAAWFRWAEGKQWPEIAEHMYGNLFYHDPAWISLHNLLHSPLVVMVALATLRLSIGNARFAESWWAWFFGSCLLHSIVDVFVHHDDGPLVLWPLNWSYRFVSPVSYWDTRHHGVEMMVLEAVLVLGLSLKLIREWWLRRKSASKTSE